MNKSSKKNRGKKLQQNNNLDKKENDNSDYKEIINSPKNMPLGNQIPVLQAHGAIHWVMVEANEYENIKKENSELKNKVFELEHNADIFRQRIASDKETIELLKKENIELKEKLAKLESKVCELEERNNALEISVNKLIAKDKDKELSNMLLDIFSYVREYIIKNKYDKNIPGLLYQEIIPTLADDDDKNYSEVITFVESIGFNVDDMAYFYDLNLGRNNEAHFINNKKYKNVMYMQQQISMFEIEIEKLNAGNKLFDRKKGLIEFVEVIKKHCN
jgi:hypothetical protein